MQVPVSVIQAYGFSEEDVSLKSFGTGLINHTWQLLVKDKAYILQRINTHVFAEPEAIHANIRMISEYLQEHHPGYLFVAPVAALNGQTLVYAKGEMAGCYRLFPFVGGSHSKDVLENANQAYEAARQFGRFTRLLSGFDASCLHTTIPSFHDLSLRYRQFAEALRNGNQALIAASREVADFLQQQYHLVERFHAIRRDPSFRIRVTHHDTKISNVLFDTADKALCVIDLDTVMPGYFISDIGDMMRTYLPTVSEEEKDTAKIDIRTEMFHAIRNGYLSEMKTELTRSEQEAFFYAAQFMIYMQALRFFTDHINNDVYYGAKYPGQNLVRAENQSVLLQRLLDKEKLLLAKG